jgi:hypothetical protein
MKIKYLRDICYDELFEKINKNYDKYISNEVWIDKYFENEDYFIESNIEINDVSLLVGNKLDYNNAILLYESMKNLTPYQATNSYLWTYLSHDRYYDYMHNRWQISKDDDPTKNNGKIKERYFCQPTRRGLLRNGISRLWWIVYLTYRNDSNNHYEYTKIIFSDEDLLIGLVERDYAMCKNVVIGILKYMQEFLDEKNRLPSRETRRNLFKYINMIGSTTLLEFLEINEIYEITKKYCINNEK